MQDGLIGKLPVRYHDQPTARLQRLRRRADDARTDRGVGRAPPVKWWIHHNDVITPLDGLGQEVVPEEAFFWHVASHVGPGRFQGLELGLVQIKRSHIRDGTGDFVGKIAPAGAEISNVTANVAGQVLRQKS